MTKETSPFRPALVIGLIVAGLVSFAAFVMLLSWGGQAGGRSGGRGTALSVAAIGFKGLVNLTDQFYETGLIRSGDQLYTDDLVVVALEPQTERSEVERLLNQRYDRPTVLILPKWDVIRDPERRGWVRSLGPDLGGAGERLLGEGAEVEILTARQSRGRTRGYDILAGLSVPVPASAQIIEGDGLEPLLTTASGDILVGRYGDHPLYVVADPDLLNNHGIADPDRARAAVQMLAAMTPDDSGPILFDLTINGYGGGRSLLRTILEPPFLAMTLALIAAAFLAGLHGAVRFGPARPPARAIPFGKAALVENSAGLVRLAHREVRLGGGYAAVVRDDAARAGAAPPNLHDEALEAYLDRFTRPGEPPFSHLANALRSARDRHDLMSAARALFRWKKDLIR
ncbi:DUF4350 domain-containing protein [Sphingosinicella sp. YJ22]|uniref:DUF4350 domain-containing protein n=1 Tax=Sphingosinicella sp. YJ22 TaxID=1104780 RepID=UPI0014099176|nr:DUF4350 domain-containing protein [Sphingosinicella sp. YJ22]